MIKRAILCMVLASPALAEQHLAELRQGILNCDSMDCAGEAANLCMDLEEGGHSTFGMMSCLIKERDVWDEQLNSAYRQARSFAKAMDEDDLENFPEFAVRATQVRDAQRAWIVFRDANCSMEYGLWGSGSMRQIAGADCLMRMTAQRTFELRAYVDGMR